MSFQLPVTYRGADGLEFSSDATKLFVIQTGSTGESGLHQYDITGDSYEKINNSRVLLSQEDYNSYTRMQLAPNGKIYITKGGGGGGDGYLGVVENPNEYGKNCFVNENGLYLDGGSSFVAKIPNFIQSYFFKPNFTFNNNCQAADIHFQLTNDFHLDSIRWYFGDGNTSNLLNPVFLYSKAGKYTVQMIAFYPDKTDTISKEITINPFSAFSLGNDTTVCKGTELTVSEKFEAYLWNTGDKTRAIKINEEAWYNVRVKNSYGCFSSDSIFLKVYNLPQIYLRDSVKLGDLDSIQLYPGNFNKYAWNTGDTTSLIYAKKAGWYSVYVENEFSCSSSKSIFVSDGSEHNGADQSDWELLNPKPSYLSGRDIAFVNDQIGFVINGKDLMKTNDCGKTWNIVMEIPNANRITFKNNIGYVIGNNGTIYKSTHLGAGWNKLTTNFTDHLNAISIIHQDTIRVTSDTKLYTTNDGGQTWETKNINNVDVEDSYFTSSLVGHVACRNGKILKTIDGGASWYVTESVNTIPSDFFTIYFVNERIGFATREHTDILKTTNGGESWEEVAGYHDAYYDFCFIDEFIGYAVGEYGVIYKTVDGGVTWNWSGFQNGRIGGSNLYGVSFIDENIGLAVGMRGLIIKTTDGGKTWATYSPTYLDVKQLDFINDEIGYALVGYDFFKTTNGGKEWINIGRPLPNEKAIQFSFINENIGYVIAGGDVGTSASSEKVFKTIDGGGSWIPTSDDFGFFHDDFYCIDFVNENLGFVSGGYNDRSVFRTKDGGNNWEKVESICMGKIQFLDSLTGYAVRIYNAFYRIYKTSDGGNTWSIVFEIEDDIKSFHFVDKDHGYIIGDDRLMYKTTDGGASWQKLEIPYEYYINVLFYNQNIGYIFDEEGNLYQTQDGGASWTKLLQTPGLSNIEIENENVFISGSNGIIMKGKVAYDSVSLCVNQAQDITNTSAKITGNATSNGAKITGIQFEYGRNYLFNQIVKTNPDFVAANSSQNIAVALSDLEPNTTYQYRLKITYQDKTVRSLVREFTTLSDYEISMDYPYVQFSDRVQLSGQILTRGGSISEVEFQYSKDSVFTGVNTIPSMVPADTMLVVSANLTGLQAQTKYFVRLKAKYGDKIIYSFTYNITTPPDYSIYFYRPYIVENKVTLIASITSNKSTITDIGFEYGTTLPYTHFIKCENSTVNLGGPRQVQVELTNLDPDSIYLYRIRAKIDSVEIYSNENILCFKNEIAMVPLKIEEQPDNSLILKALVLTNGAYMNNIQFLFGISEEFGDSVKANPSYVAGYNTTMVSASLKRLDPNTKYYFKVNGYKGNVPLYSNMYSYITNNPLGIKQRLFESDILVYPNPTDSYVTISSSEKITKIDIISMDGKLIRSEQNTSTINIESFPPGIYFLKAFIGNNIFSQKIIKK
jgi:photosystem II stability/assembly factor-like uncharacterized protein